MSKKDLPNPFQGCRSSVTESSSLLSYGQDKYSVFKILRGESKLYRSQATTNDREMENEILKKYQQQYYSLDQSGVSLAERAFQEKVEMIKSQKEDFWTIHKIQHSVAVSNPFGSKFSADVETTSNFSVGSFVQNESTKKRTEGNIKDRRQKRQQIGKIKHRIQAKKLEEIKLKEQEQKFSLAKMYKKRQPEEVFGLGTTVTFGGQGSRRDELKFEYPQSIYVGEEQFFFVPLH